MRVIMRHTYRGIDFAGISKHLHKLLDPSSEAEK